MSIVTLDTAKQHLNITDDGDNAVIQSKINAAEAHIEQMLGFALASGFTSSAGVPDDVREAILQLTGHSMRTGRHPLSVSPRRKFLSAFGT